MDFIKKPLRDIEPQLSAMGYKFVREVSLSGKSFILNYENHSEKRKVQLVMELYAKNAFCKQIYEEEIGA